MKKELLIVGASVLLTGCASISSSEEESPVNSEETASTTQELPENEEAEDEKEEEAETVKPEDSLSPEELVIPTVPVESPYDEDGNIKHTHNEQEIVDEYIDEDGRIYFSLDDDPIRNITKVDNDSIIHVTNYSDAFIDIIENEAFLLNEEQKEYAYNLVIDNPPIGFEQPDLSEYRSWEEATNLERGMMQMTILVAPTIYNLLYLMEEDLYEHESFTVLLGELERAASPAVQLPAPQTMNDVALFESMQRVQELWREVGQFEDPANHKEEFVEVHQMAREETNHLLAKVHATLSESRP